jgi:hypothetical protein
MKTEENDDLCIKVSITVGPTLPPVKSVTHISGIISEKAKKTPGKDRPTKTGSVVAHFLDFAGIEHGWKSWESCDSIDGDLTNMYESLFEIPSGKYLPTGSKKRFKLLYISDIAFQRNFSQVQLASLTAVQEIINHLGYLSDKIIISGDLENFLVNEDNRKMFVQVHPNYFEISRSSVFIESTYY